MARKKQKADAHGRNTYKAGPFSRVEIDMQKSPAFQSLPASAVRVLLWALNKCFQSATKAGATGKPRFKLTNAEAKNDYGLSAATFTNAKYKLEERGFLEWVERGGLKGCNGICSLFCLSSKWKEWSPPPKKPYANLKNARAVKSKKGVMK